MSPLNVARPAIFTANSIAVKGEVRRYQNVPMMAGEYSELAHCRNLLFVPTRRSSSFSGTVTSPPAGISIRAMVRRAGEALLPDDLQMTAPVGKWSFDAAAVGSIRSSTNRPLSSSPSPGSNGLPKLMQTPTGLPSDLATRRQYRIASWKRRSNATAAPVPAALKKLIGDGLSMSL